MTHAWFEFLPLPLFVAAMLLVVFGSIEFGFRLASHFKKRREPGAAEAPISSVIGGSLAAGVSAGIHVRAGGVAI